MKTTSLHSYGMTPVCPKCSRMIPGDDVNVARDVAYCRSCNLANKLSLMISGSELTDGIDLGNPPRGVRYDIHGGGIVASATHRALGSAVGILAAALFWNGIVSIFVLIAISGTLSNLHVSVPKWFPSPEMNGGPMSSGATVFLWIFLTPFIVIGTIMIGTFFLTVGGRTEIRIDQNIGSVFTGVGPLGYRRRFMTSEVSDVRIEDGQWPSSDGDGQRKTCVIIETREGRIIKFGSMLSPERRRFMAGVLHKTLVLHK